MDEPLLGFITLFACADQKVPRGWALCHGQLLTINQNTALFSLLGNAYGGDGKANFALPNLQGRVPVGTGPGYELGKPGGNATVTLTADNLPPHTHTVNAYKEVGDSADPKDRLLANTDVAGTQPDNEYRTAGTAVSMNADAITISGGGQSINMMKPFVALNYIMAIQGVYPARQ